MSETLDQLLPGGYLKAVDILGQTPTVHITNFRIDSTVNDNDQPIRVAVAVLAWPPAMPLNKDLRINNQVNKESIKRIFGTGAVEELQAKAQASPMAVTLYTEPTEKGAGIRIRAATDPAPSQQTQAQPQPADAMDPATMQQMMAMMQQMMGQKPQQ